MHLYLHVPFCKQACHYCDFHFSTNLAQRAEMVTAICREITLQKNFLRPPTDKSTDKLRLDTIYFGGGTPSLLTPAELAQVFDAIGQHFAVAPDAEITLEANPDDLTAERLASLRDSPVNRLSIGIQSFHAPHLRYLHRAHDAAQAAACVAAAQQAGFHNLSIDLIYAIPAPDHTIWKADLAQAAAFDVPHVSAYCLTIEPRTAFGNWLEKGKIKAVDEEFAAHQYEMLVANLTARGYEHYEISSFAQPGQYARHNTSYWRQVPYLGVGPSAHSFNGTARQANVAHNVQYLRALATDRIPATPETLDPRDHINEYLLTGLRTQWGCDTRRILAQFGVDVLKTHQAYLAQSQQDDLTTVAHGVIRLTTRGKLFADQIAADLFVD